jgi:hypothetical protein
MTWPRGLADRCAARKTCLPPPPQSTRRDNIVQFRSLFCGPNCCHGGPRRRPAQDAIFPVSWWACPRAVRTRAARFRLFSTRRSRPRSHFAGCTSIIVHTHRLHRGVAQMDRDRREVVLKTRIAAAPPVVANLDDAVALAKSYDFQRSDLPTTLSRLLRARATSMSKPPRRISPPACVMLIGGFGWMRILPVSFRNRRRYCAGRKPLRLQRRLWRITDKVRTFQPSSEYR